MLFIYICQIASSKFTSLFFFFFRRFPLLFVTSLFHICNKKWVKNQFLFQARNDVFSTRVPNSESDDERSARTPLHRHHGILHQTSDQVLQEGSYFHVSVSVFFCFAIHLNKLKKQKCYRCAVYRMDIMPLFGVQFIV